MSNRIIREHNCETNEFIERDMTNEELAEWTAINAEREKEALELAAKAEAKAQLLEKLGITADEAKLLLS